MRERAQKRKFEKASALLNWEKENTGKQVREQSEKYPTRENIFYILRLQQLHVVMYIDNLMYIKAGVVHIRRTVKIFQLSDKLKELVTRTAKYFKKNFNSNNT